jgi:hypothetical protein
MSARGGISSRAVDRTYPDLDALSTGRYRDTKQGCQPIRTGSYGKRSDLRSA